MPPIETRCTCGGVAAPIEGPAGVLLRCNSCGRTFGGAAAEPRGAPAPVAPPTSRSSRWLACGLIALFGLPLAVCGGLLAAAAGWRVYSQVDESRRHAAADAQAAVAQAAVAQAAARTVEPTSAPPPIDPVAWTAKTPWFDLGFVPVFGGGDSRACRGVERRGTELFLRGVDLSTGEPLETISLGEIVPGASGGVGERVAAVSPSGRRVAAWEGTERLAPLQVWDCSGAPALLLTIPPPPVGLDRYWFARFVDEETIVTALSGGSVEWRSLTDGTVKARVVGQGVTTTPGGRFVTVLLGAKLQFYAASSGKLVAWLDVGRGILTRPQVVAFHPDGRRLIVFGRDADGRGNWLEERDLATGRSTALVPLPDVESFEWSAWWVEDERVVIGRYVYDVEAHRVLGVYPRMPTFAAAAGGRVWTSSPPGAPPTIGAATALSPADRARVPERLAVVPTTLAAGETIGVTIQFEANPPSSALREKVVAAIETQIRDAGFGIAATSRRSVRIVVRDVPGQGSVLFQRTTTTPDPLGGMRERAAGEPIRVAQRELSCEWKFAGGAGLEDWSRRTAVDVDSVHRVRDRRLLATDEQAILDTRWTLLVERLADMKFPPMIVDYSDLPTLEMPAPAGPPSAP